MKSSVHSFNVYFFHGGTKCRFYYQKFCYDKRINYIKFIPVEYAAPVASFTLTKSCSKSCKTVPIHHVKSSHTHHVTHIM